MGICLLFPGVEASAAAAEGCTDVAASAESASSVVECDASRPTAVDARVDLFGDAASVDFQVRFMVVFGRG